MINIATTGIWKVSKRLDTVLKYTTNADKTDGENYKELHNVIDYSTSSYKTEEQLYVTGINCNNDTAYEEMIITKKQYHKEDGILAFHAFQSFKEGEVDAKTCHEIGIKLANEMWGDRFEVVVSTHLNTNHYHNHFVINSVSFKDGKRYYDKRSTYAELRHISDSICSEYGLSVVKEEKKPKYKINYDNYHKYNMEHNNYYVGTKKDLDRAIGMASSYKDFENILIAMNYHIYYRYDKLTIRKDPYKKNIRVVRCFGEDYSKERIIERIKTEKIPKVPFLDIKINNKYYNKLDYKKDKPKGIYALYLHYCYLLNVFPKSNPHKRLPASIREDSNKLDLIINETKLLTENKLETDEQFFLFKNNNLDKLNNLLDTREKLWYQYNKNKDDNLLNEINKTKIEIDKVRSVIKLCDGIEERIPKIERNVNEFITQERKESEKSEHIK